MPLVKAIYAHLQNSHDTLFDRSEQVAVIKRNCHMVEVGSESILFWSKTSENLTEKTPLLHTFMPNANLRLKIASV